MRVALVHDWMVRPGGGERVLWALHLLATIHSPAIAQYQWATFFPDGQRLLVLGSDQQGAIRLFVEELEGETARPLTPPGVITTLNTISPDGRSVIAFGFARPDEPSIYPVDGGPPSPLKGLVPGETVIRWRPDGRSVLIASQDHFRIIA